MISDCGPRQIKPLHESLRWKTSQGNRSPITRKIHMRALSRVYLSEGYVRLETSEPAVDVVAPHMFQERCKCQHACVSVSRVFAPEGKRTILEEAEMTGRKSSTSCSGAALYGSLLATRGDRSCKPEPSGVDGV